MYSRIMLELRVTMFGSRAEEEITDTTSSTKVARGLKPAHGRARETEEEVQSFRQKWTKRAEETPGAK